MTMPPRGTAPGRALGMRLGPLVWVGVIAWLTAPAEAARFSFPRPGREFVFGQEANVNSLDMMTSSAISTRNIAMNVFETLVTRDDRNQPSAELAESVTEAPDRLGYSFRLRQDVRFHNGKTMSSADVLASFERY